MNKNHFLFLEKKKDSDCHTTSLCNFFSKKLEAKNDILSCDLFSIVFDRKFSISELQKNIIKPPV